MTFKGDTFIEVASCLARTDPNYQPSFYEALEVVKRYSRSKIGKGKGRQFVGRGGKLEDLEKKYAHLGYQDIFYLVRLHMGFPPSSLSLPRPTSPIEKVLIRAKYPLPNYDQDVDPDPFGSHQHLSIARDEEKNRITHSSSWSSAPNTGEVNRPSTRSVSNIGIHSPTPKNLLQPPNVPIPARRSSDLERLGLPETFIPVPSISNISSYTAQRPRTAPSPSHLPPPTTPLPATPSPPFRHESAGAGTTRPFNIPHRQISNYFSSASSASSITSSPTSPLTPLIIPSSRTPVPESWSMMGRTNSLHSNRSTYSPVSGRPNLNLSHSSRSIESEAEADEEDELLRRLTSDFNLAENGPNSKRNQSTPKVENGIEGSSEFHTQAQAQEQGHGRSYLVITNPDIRTGTPSRSGSGSGSEARQLHTSKAKAALESSWRTGIKTPPPKYEERL